MMQGLLTSLKNPIELSWIIYAQILLRTIIFLFRRNLLLFVELSKINLLRKIMSKNMEKTVNQSL